MESILVYVIIGVIYFVAKAMNKNKDGQKPKGKPVNQPRNQQSRPQQRQPQQRQVEQKESDAPKQPATFEDLLGELLGEQPKKKPVPPQPVEVINTDEFELARQRKLEEDRTRKQKERAEIERRAKVQQQEVLRRKAMMAKLAVESHQDYKKPKLLSPKKIAKSFDLRQAIIAKAILDRPYIDEH